MWKRLLFVYMLMATGPATADQVTLKWEPAGGATTYTIYMSADLGVTWTKAASSPLPSLVLTVDGTKLILFRVAAVNGIGESLPDYRGAWYNGAWNQQPNHLSVK